MAVSARVQTVRPPLPPPILLFPFREEGEGDGELTSDTFARYNGFNVMANRGPRFSLLFFAQFFWKSFESYRIDTRLW